MTRLTCSIMLCIALMPALAIGDPPPYQPVEANLKARKWFQDAKFGLFIHWGAYSVLGDNEWVMNNRKISVREYEKVVSKFNPTQFNAEEWVSLAKSAGMKYITITAKHHDGFAMWNSASNPYNIVKQTPYEKDVLKLLADECRKQQMPLFWYYSHLDWHHPDYYPWGQTGHNTGRVPSGSFPKYLDAMDAQLKELLTDYGPIAGIWFDGWWDHQMKTANNPLQTRVDWRLRQTYDLIHRLQPQALVGNNHHVSPFDGEDFQMFEKDLPGQNTTGLSGDSKAGKLPLESCETISRAWGYNRHDTQYKSTRDLLHFMINSAGRNANCLLNVGPMPSGLIQPEAVERIQEMGRWMKKYGESIYGTRGGPFPPAEWGVSTERSDGSLYYLHVLNPNTKTIRLANFRAKSIKGWDSTKPKSIVAIRVDEKDTIIELDPSRLDPIDTILIIQPQS